MTRYDAVIVGGGLAGAALAAQLGQAGRSVVVFEKEKGAHDKVCGEFISHEGARYLANIGIPLGALEAQKITHVGLARRGQRITALLPFEAMSLSRRVLDEALLLQASRNGAEVRRGGRVKEIEKHGAEWIVRLESDAAVRSKTIFLASGKHDLKGWKRPPGPQSDLLAFKAYWRLQPQQAAELAQHVELILFPGGYAGLQMVEAGRANLCLLVRKSMFASKYQSWHNLLNAMLGYCEQLRIRLEGAECLVDRPLAIAALPYGYVAKGSEGIWRVGDQAAVIPSFSGDGMSIALHSARRAAECYLRGDDAGTYQRELARDLSRQVWRATVLSQLLVRSYGQHATRALAGALPCTLSVSALATRIPARSLTL